MSDKPKAFIKKYKQNNLPASYVEYKPYVPSSKPEKIRTHRDKDFRLF